ncbi:hypothetical protein EV363DRAFT_1447035 [Boletus edulis]|nr:hypothetical protein EV363DRAFT_1447035 [Boletus edulis]
MVSFRVALWNVCGFIVTPLSFLRRGLSQHATHPQPVLCIPASTDINRTGSGLADYKENAAFSDKDLGGIRNVARRAILSLERIADPLRLLLIETTNYASALSFEIIRGPAPEFRDFVRLKFKNGTEDAELQTLYIFDHPDESVLVTEFIYRLIVDDALLRLMCLQHHVVSGSPFRVLLVPLVVAVFAFAAYRTQTRPAKRHDAMRQNEKDTFVNEKSRLLP